MNLSELHKKLIAVARANPPGDAVPLSFEKRIMALIAARPVMDRWAVWARGLWYAAAPCVAVMLLFSAWAFVPSTNETASGDLSYQFDSAMLAAVDQVNADNDPTW